MGKFLDHQKKHQTKVKASTDLFSQDARQDGVYKGKPRSFCLPKEFATENLFVDIRSDALTYFEAQGISWHDGSLLRPSNHLCDSQVCCVNFLFPFANHPDALKQLLHPFYPHIDHMLPIEGDDTHVGFEWIGAENYLGEMVRGKRTRGKNSTSADAIVRFQCVDGTQQIVLIEWKYTESYSKTSLAISRSGTDRTAIYQHLFDREDFPLDKNHLLDFESLFYEPFYQLMRQQLLAQEMEIANEMNADRVTTLHIAPHANTDFQKVTSIQLQSLGNTVTEIWSKLVTNPTSFLSVTTERLFTPSIVEAVPDMQTWWDYVTRRYAFLQMT